MTTDLVLLETNKKVHKPYKVIRPNRKETWDDWVQISILTPTKFRVGYKVADTRVYTYLEHCNPFKTPLTAVVPCLLGFQGAYKTIETGEWYVSQFMEWVTNEQQT